MKRILALLTALVVLSVAAGCGGGDDGGSEEGGGGGGEGDALMVFASADLQNDLEVLAEAYAEEVPDAPIEFTFGGGNELLTQITDGAEAELFIGPATNVDTLEGESKLVGEVVPFGTDEMVIITPDGNPAGVTGPDAFGDNPAVNSGVCEPEARCGEGAEVVLRRAGVTPAPDSVEPTASDLVTKVSDGTLTAGMVWRTQSTNGRLTIVTIAPDVGRQIVYEVGPLSSNGQVQEFLDWLEGETAQRILRERGLLPPPEGS